MFSTNMLSISFSCVILKRLLDEATVVPSVGILRMAYGDGILLEPRAGGPLGIEELSLYS